MGSANNVTILANPNGNTGSWICAKDALAVAFQRHFGDDHVIVWFRSERRCAYGLSDRGNLGSRGSR